MILLLIALVCVLLAVAGYIVGIVLAVNERVVLGLCAALAGQLLSVLAFVLSVLEFIRLHQ